MRVAHKVSDHHFHHRIAVPSRHRTLHGLHQHLTVGVEKCTTINPRFWARQLYKHLHPEFLSQLLGAKWRLGHDIGLHSRATAHQKIQQHPHSSLQEARGKESNHLHGFVAGMNRVKHCKRNTMIFFFVLQHSFTKASTNSHILCRFLTIYPVLNLDLWNSSHLIHSVFFGHLFRKQFHCNRQNFLSKCTDKFNQTFIYEETCPHQKVSYPHKGARKKTKTELQ